jgi:hypothetical protein
VPPKWIDFSSFEIQHVVVFFIAVLYKTTFPQKKKSPEIILRDFDDFVYH